MKNGFHQSNRKNKIHSLTRKFFQFNGPFILALSCRMALIRSTLIIKTTRSPAICEFKTSDINYKIIINSLAQFRKHTSIVQLLFNFDLLPCSNGIPSMNSGRLPSFAIKKSPLLRSFIVPCRRETLHAGPSSDKSTSTDSWSDFRPNVIYKMSNEMSKIHKKKEDERVKCAGHYLTRTHQITNESSTQHGQR